MSSAAGKDVAPAATGGMSSPWWVEGPFVRRSTQVSWLLAALFVLGAGLTCASLVPNFDEGVYILQARAVREGGVPYVDFFYHQTPVYLYALAAFGSLAPDSLVWHRLLSIVAVGLAGVVVMRLARRRSSVLAALLAQVLFYVPPLQIHGTLALPNGLMVLCSCLGIYVALDGERVVHGLLAGALLALSVFIKPLAVPEVLAAVVGLLLSPTYRSRAPAVIAGGVLTGLTGWGVFHVLSNGGFTELLVVQADRYARSGGFEYMMYFDEFREAAAARGSAGPLWWNVIEHYNAFLTLGPLNGNLGLLVAVLVSPWVGLRRMPRDFVGILAAWLVLPVLFSLFVWEPSWDHYFMVYLPPMAIVAGTTFASALTAARRGWRITGAVALVLVVGASLVLRPTAPQWYDDVRTTLAKAGDRPVFTFDPLMYVVSGREPTCGIIDPINVYGEICAANLTPGGPLTRFNVHAKDLVDCLGPDVVVVLDHYAFWFLDATVLEHLAKSRDRVIYFTPEDENRFARALRRAATLPGRGGRAVPP